jgi:SH3-like domain-containing protein
MLRGACIVSVAFVFSAIAAADEFPYVAYVKSNEVHARSGPGRDYYPTLALKAGEAVEVYRRDPGGWLAIRPPHGSFSWVAARHLDVLEDSLARATSDRVVVRVGSELSDSRDVIHVRLARDEKVELVEPLSDDSPWCKIVPPAGEFRWIFEKHVDREPPAEARRGKGRVPANGRVRLTGGAEDEEEPTDESSHGEISADLARLRELENIDMELSQILVTDISTWSFDDLKKRAQATAATAQSSLESGMAQVLIDKLARFEDIKRRHDAIRAAPPAAPANEFGVSTGFRRFTRYDGIGRLAPVVSQRPGGPQYALLDASGAVVSFVTPAPGVNLRPFVDKQVGVNGQRGYLTDLQRAHISVQRVSVLDDPATVRR